MTIAHYGMVFLITIIGTQGYIQLARRRGIIDVPNQRSSHQHPTPRGGGIVFVGIWLSLQPFLAEVPSGLFLGGALIALVSFWDDIKGLSPKLRLIAQFMGSCLFVFLLSPSGLVLWGLPSSLSIALAVLALVWSINLFNFMDGTDGLAATEALSVLLPGIVLLKLYNAYALANTCLLLSVGLLAFLFFNRPQARVFMGDVASSFLGFFIASIAITAYVRYQAPLWYWGVLYGAFIFDATVTLFRRWVAGERITQAHKSHAYQRLHQAGWSHQKLLIGLLMLNMFLMALLAWAINAHIAPVIILGIALITLSVVYIAIEKKNPRTIMKG